MIVRETLLLQALMRLQLGTFHVHLRILFNVTECLYGMLYAFSLWLILTKHIPFSFFRVLGISRHYPSRTCADTHSAACSVKWPDRAYRLGTSNPPTAPPK